jgi:hypothetical protein
MGRPKTDNPRTNRVQLLFTDDELASVKSASGNVPLGRFLREAILQAIIGAKRAESDK